MVVERIGADVRLQREPRTATEAYNMLIASLSAEIEEKQTIINELKNEDVKSKFFRLWRPGIKDINIYDVV